MRIRKKIVWSILAVMLATLVALVIFLTFFLGATVRKGVVTFAPKLTKTRVEVGSVQLSLWTGYCRISDLRIGNPEGFETPDAFRLKEIVVKLRPMSLFGKEAIIDSVSIVGPEITYERALSGDNISKIRENIENALKKEKTEDAEEAAAAKQSEKKSEKPKKTYLIKALTVRDGTVKVSATLLAGSAIGIPLPDIRLTDLGGQKKEGVTLTEVCGEVADAMTGAMNTALSGANVLSDAGKDVGNAATDALNGVGKKASGALKTLKDAF